MFRALEFLDDCQVSSAYSYIPDQAQYGESQRLLSSYL